MTGGTAAPDPAVHGTGQAGPGHRDSSAEPGTSDQLAGLAALRSLAAVQQQARQADAETIVFPAVPPQARRTIELEVLPSSRFSSWWRLIFTGRKLLR
jgi:hypothetical protein